VGAADQRPEANDHHDDHHDADDDDPDRIHEPVEHHVTHVTHVAHVAHVTDDHHPGAPRCTATAGTIAEPIELTGAQTRHRYTGVP
jgi:hypothetical protein